MSKAARRTIMLLIALGLAVSMTSWVVAQQPTAPAQPPAQTRLPEADEEDSHERHGADAGVDPAPPSGHHDVRDGSDARSGVEAFWPLYRDYRMEMAKVGDRVAKAARPVLRASTTRSPTQQASKIMKEWLQRREGEDERQGQVRVALQEDPSGTQSDALLPGGQQARRRYSLAQLASVVPLAR